MFFAIWLYDFWGKEDFSLLRSLEIVLMLIMVNCPFLLQHQIMYKQTKDNHVSSTNDYNSVFSQSLF